MKAFLILTLAACAVAYPMPEPDYGWPQPSYAVAQPVLKQVIQPTVVKTISPAATSYSTFTQSHVSHPQIVKVAHPVYAQPVVKVAQPVAYAHPVQYVQQPLVKQVVNPW